MKFGSTQRQALLHLANSKEKQGYKDVSKTCERAAKGDPRARERLDQAVSTVARIFDRPKSKVVHAMYTDEIQARITDHDRFWTQLDNLL
jgi:hypothetical protein